MKYSSITTRNKRRYYLHKRIAPQCNKIMAKKKLIYLYDYTMQVLTSGQKRNLAELQNKYGYSVQLQIPDESPNT